MSGKIECSIKLSEEALETIKSMLSPLPEKRP